MKKGNLLLDAGIVGLALFATIFGAGNLVFPPILGLTAGTDWVPATLGLLLSGIVLPVLGTWAVNCVGDHAEFLNLPCISEFLYDPYVLFSASRMRGIHTSPCRSHNP